MFGNLIATANFTQMASELVITGEVSVALYANEWPIFRIAPEAHSYPFDSSAGEKTDLGALRIPEDPRHDTALRSWAHGFVYSRRTDTLSLLKDINAGISGAVAYRVRDEEGTQTASETLEIASGSCRDIAALFIEVVGRGRRRATPEPRRPGRYRAAVGIGERDLLIGRGKHQRLVCLRPRD